LAAFFSYIRHDNDFDGTYDFDETEIQNILSSDSIVISIKNYIKSKYLTDDGPNLKIIKFLEGVECFDESMFRTFPNIELILKMDKTYIDFIDNYFDSRLLSDIISFDWVYSETSSGELSSGEKTYFSLFARFFDVSIKHAKFLKNIIILIDEGEYQLHPEWQRKYISWLTSYFSEIFVNTESIQIILTSHSPFILSDLRKDDVILLEKDDEGISHICSLDKHDKTFGANIYTLYADTFFMNKCLMGEFSKSKIDTLIKFLATEKESDKKTGLDKKSSQMLINEIGEPVLKEHLQSIWNENFKVETDKSNMEYMATRIAELERENKKLKNETNRNS
jgi:hypothetical protein